MEKPAKERIMEWIFKIGKPQAIHEIQLYGLSQNNIATRLSELTKDGKLICRYRTDNGKKCSYKEWAIEFELF